MEFMHFKEGWRVYDGPDAEDVLVHVCAFLERLTKLDLKE